MATTEETGENGTVCGFDAFRISVNNIGEKKGHRETDIVLLGQGITFIS
jgi:hypothetical protein